MRSLALHLRSTEDRDLQHHHRARKAPPAGRWSLIGLYWNTNSPPLTFGGHVATLLFAGRTASIRATDQGAIGAAGGLDRSADVHVLLEQLGCAFIEACRLIRAQLAAIWIQADASFENISTRRVITKINVQQHFYMNSTNLRSVDLQCSSNATSDPSHALEGTRGRIRSSFWTTGTIPRRSQVLVSSLKTWH